MLNDLLFRLRSLLQRKTAEAELDAELRFHLEQQMEKQVRSGMTPADAARQTRLCFGGVDQVKEECRDARGVHFLETLLQDVRYSLRTLAKSPGFAAIAVLTLSIGIGANTAIFSMVDWLMLRPLPVRDPGQLAYLVVQQANGSYVNGFSYPNFDDIRAQTTSIFSSMAAVQPFQMDGLSVDGKTSPIWTNYVAGDFFGMLGIQPALGRFILASEGKPAAADPVLVISYSYWQAHFGADPAIVGKKAAVNGRPVTIIGVAPKGFRGALAILDTQGYLPLGMAPGVGEKPGYLSDRREQIELLVVARLKPGVTPARAQTVLNTVARRLAQQYPKTDDWKSMRAATLGAAPPSASPGNPLTSVAAIFLSLAGLVLLLACVNIAGLALVQGGMRSREMAVRSALGAARSRLLRQLLTDSLLLALLGCAGGIAAGMATSRVLSALPLGSAIPVVLNFGFSWRVFAYAVACALATAIAIGVVPAVRGSRLHLSDVLHQSSRSFTAGRQKLRSALIVAEVSGSLMLLVVAGLFVRSLGMVQHVDLGFDPGRVLNLSMDPHEAGYNPVRGRAFFDGLLARVRQMGGVQSASVAATVPMGLYSYGSMLTIEGSQPAANRVPAAGYNAVSPGYFATMRIPLLRGRDFLDADNPGSARVAVINQAMANEDWPGQDPIGRRFVLREDPDHTVEVVGIVKNSRTGSIADTIGPYFYLPFAQKYLQPATLHIRSVADDPLSLARPLLQTIRSLEPAMPVFDVQSMRSALETLNGLLMFKIGAWLAGALGFLGLLLAIVGVYGVVSYSATQRTHEIGIRMALGARPGAILKMMFRQGLVLVAAGVIVGLMLAAAAARSVASLLVGVAPLDPVTFAGASLLLALIALGACYIPARRATRVDPLVSLRHD